MGRNDDLVNLIDVVGDLSGQPSPRQNLIPGEFFLNSIKILAERVSQQQNVNNMQAANNREVYNRAYVLEDRIKKLEEHKSRCHGDPESGDPADINQNPQANNPLTKEEISILVSWFDVLMEKYAHYYIDRAIKLKLESYLETK